MGRRQCEREKNPAVTRITKRSPQVALLYGRFNLKSDCEVEYRLRYYSTRHYKFSSCFSDFTIVWQEIQESGSSSDRVQSNTSSEIELFFFKVKQDLFVSCCCFFWSVKMDKMGDVGGGDVDTLFEDFLLANMRRGKEKGSVTYTEVSAFIDATPLDAYDKSSLRQLLWFWRDRRPEDTKGLSRSKTSERVDRVVQNAAIKWKKEKENMRRRERERMNSIVRTVEFNEDLRYISFPLFPSSAN